MLYNNKIIKIFENNIKKMQKENNIPETIHEDEYFSLGIKIGMESLYEYLDENYDITYNSATKNYCKYVHAYEHNIDNKNSLGRA